MDLELVEVDSERTATTSHCHVRRRCCCSLTPSIHPSIGRSVQAS